MRCAAKRSVVHRPPPRLRGYRDKAAHAKIVRKRERAGFEQLDFNFELQL
jgi:hypothetical protein